MPVSTAVHGGPSVTQAPSQEKQKPSAIKQKFQAQLSVPEPAPVPRHSSWGWGWGSQRDRPHAVLPPPRQHRREAGAAELWPAVLGLGQAAVPSAGADPRRPHSLAISPGPGQPKGPARRGRRAAPQQSGTSPPASRALGAQPVPVDALGPQGCCRQTLSASAPAVLCRWWQPLPEAGKAALSPPNAHHSQSRAGWHFCHRKRPYTQASTLCQPFAVSRQVNVLAKKAQQLSSRSKRCSHEFYPLQSRRSCNPCFGTAAAVGEKLLLYQGQTIKNQRLRLLFPTNMEKQGHLGGYAVS